MRTTAVTRSELLALANERRGPIRRYLQWALENERLAAREDGGASSLRMERRFDIRDAADVAELFGERWWSVVVFTCFGSKLGSETVAPRFRPSTTCALGSVCWGPYDEQKECLSPSSASLKVTWKVTPLTAENDPDGRLRERQLQVIGRLLRRASENAEVESQTEVAEPDSAASPENRSTLQCSPMATEVPQRQLRNNTASLLRRVEAGEHLRITVHGHPVAELVPVDHAHPFVPFDKLVSELRGTMLPDDHLDKELRELDEVPQDPFA